MTISIHEQSIGAMSRALSSLAAIVDKAEAHAEERGIDHDALLHARLFPDMLDFIRQIQIASDTAKGAAARLSGVEMPSWEDDEASFADVRARIQKTLDYLAGFQPEMLDGADSRPIELKLGPRTVHFDGKSYLLGFVLPNFYFHVTTAYNILRHNGVEIGKRDYLGATDN